MQKTKLEALKIELESETSTLISKETQVSELENKGKNITEETKKYLSQMNNLNQKLENLKEIIKEQNNSAKENEKELQISKNVTIFKRFLKFILTLDFG